MVRNRMIKVLALALLCSMLVVSLLSCGGTEEPAPPAEAEPTTAAEVEPTEAAEPTEAPEPEAEETSVTILSMEDPPSFNHWITDTGYENLVAEMTLLGMADIGPNSEIFPELAAELGFSALSLVLAFLEFRHEVELKLTDGFVDELLLRITQVALHLVPDHVQNIDGEPGLNQIFFYFIGYRIFDLSHLLPCRIGEGHHELHEQELLFLYPLRISHRHLLRF